MISLTEEARKELEAYFEGKEKTPIRVYLAPGGHRADLLGQFLIDVRLCPQKDARRHHQDKQGRKSEADKNCTADFFCISRESFDNLNDRLIR